jgi:hypothetical protein
MVRRAKTEDFPTRRSFLSDKVMYLYRFKVILINVYVLLKKYSYVVSLICGISSTSNRNSFYGKGLTC